MSKQVGRVFLTLGFLVVVACGVSGGPSLLSSNSPQPTPSQVGSLPDLQYVDASGVLYIADSSNNAIRKVANGTITTIAGIGGVSGSTGDGGLATAAKLSFPVSVVVDKAGANLYIADYSNYVIRKVNLSTGIITTVAGTIGVSGATGDGGAATSAELSSPTAITIDGTGNLYIADSSNCAIRKVNAISGIITTVVGTLGSCGSTGDNGPATSATIAGYSNVVVDTVGNIYIGDYSNNAIRVVPVSTGIITTIIGTIGSSGYSPDGTLGTSAQLNGPAMGSVDNAGNVYFLDGCSMVRKLNLSTGTLVTLSGINGSYGSTGDGGPASAALMECPSYTAFDTAGNLYVADTGNSTMRMINTAGIISRIAGTIGVSTFSGDGGAATNATLQYPFYYTY